MSQTDRTRALLAMLALGSVAACSDSGAPSPTAGPEPVARVELERTTVELELRDSVRLAAVATTASGVPVATATVTWASDAPDVARVDSRGVVTGLSAGTATITASSEGASAQATATVLAWNVADNLEVVDSTALDLLSDSTERETGIYRFQVLQPPAPAFDPGDVIVGAQRLGFLRRVVSAGTEGDVVTLQTEPAALSDVVEEGGFETSIDLFFAPGAPTLIGPVEPGQVRWGQPVFAAAEGVSFTAAGINLSGMDICKKLKEAGGPNCPSEISKFEIRTGVLDFAPKLDVSADFDGFSLAEFRGVADGTVHADFSLLLEVKGSVSPIKPQIDLGKVTRPFYALIGPLPVLGYVELGLTGGLEAKATAEGSVQAGFTNTHNVQVGAEWDPTVGWTPVFQSQRTFDAQLPDLQDGTLSGQIDVETKLFLKPELKMIFYGVIGPFANVEPFGKFTLTFGTSACGMKSEAGINSEIGFTIPFLDPDVGNFSKKESPWFSWPGRSWDCPLGRLDVTTVTNGSSPDTDGYTIFVDDVDKGTVGSNAQTLLDFIEVGPRKIRLGGVATNCSVVGNNPREVTVTTGLVTAVPFEIDCQDPGGDLEIEIRTSGTPPDPDGYTLTIDGSQSRAAGVNGTVTVQGLTSGDHQLAMSDIAPNCLLVGPNPRTVTVPTGGSVGVVMEIQCSASELTVRTVTTGTPAASNWSVRVDGSENRSIGPNGQVTFEVSPGTHQVELREVAPNCSIQGSNPRDIDLTGGSATETFNVSCAIGGLTVTVQTTGDPDPATSYTVDVGGDQKSVSVDGSVEFPNLPEGPTSVHLIDVPGHCLVEGENPRTVDVPGSVDFTVLCQTPLTCGTPPEPATLDEYVDDTAGTTSVVKKEYGWVEVSVSGTAGPVELGAFSEAGSEWVDWIKLLPVDPSRVGETVDFSWTVTRSMTVSPGVTESARPWSATRTSDGWDGIGFGYENVTTRTYTTTETVRILLGTFWEYWIGSAQAAVSVDNGTSGSATASVRLVRLEGVKDLAGNDVPIAQVCSASGTNYPR